MPHSLIKFERWFAGPIRFLSTIEGGDGAFVTLSVSFGLFERYVKSHMKRSGDHDCPANYFALSARITGLDEDLFRKFWGMFRDGIQHYLQPKTFQSGGVNYCWSTSADYPALPYYLVNTREEKTIAVNPWKWSDFVLKLYENDPTILEVMESHSLGHIYDRGAGGGSGLSLAILPMLLCDDPKTANE